MIFSSPSAVLGTGFPSPLLAIDAHAHYTHLILRSRNAEKNEKAKGQSKLKTFFYNLKLIQALLLHRGLKYTFLLCITTQLVSVKLER